MSTQRGTGDPAWRFTTPVERACARPTARKENVAMTTPNEAIPGARNCTVRTPSRSSTTSLPTSAESSTKNSRGRPTLRISVMGVRHSAASS